MQPFTLRLLCSFSLVVLLLAGCSSSDLTASDEYLALEQQLADTEQQLAEANQGLTQAETQLSAAVAERDALQAEPASGEASGVSQDVGRGHVPDDVVALIGQWWQATESSMADLYTTTGFHLYGTERFTGDEIFPHLDSPSVSQEELTPLLLVADEPGRYVVTQGLVVTNPYGEFPSGFSWEIVATDEDTLKIAQTAWFQVTG